MSTPITLETVQKAWRVFSQVDQTLSTDDALEAGFIARNDEVADLVQERDAARAEVGRLTALVGEARRLIRDLLPLLGGDDDLPYSEKECDCTVCVGGRAFLAKTEATDAAT